MAKLLGAGDPRPHLLLVVKKKSDRLGIDGSVVTSVCTTPGPHKKFSMAHAQEEPYACGGRENWGPQATSQVPGSVRDPISKE